MTMSQPRTTRQRHPDSDPCSSRFCRRMPLTFAAKKLGVLLFLIGFAVLCSSCWHPQFVMAQRQQQRRMTGSPQHTKQHRKLVQVHPDEVIPDCYVVELYRLEDLDQLLREYASEVTLTRVYRQVLHGFATCFRDHVDDENTNILQRLLDDERVKRIGQDGTLLDEQQQRPPPSNLLIQVQPDAPFHLDRIDGTLDESYQHVLDGTGVTVYVMDSGTRATHEEFQDRVDTQCFSPNVAAPCHQDSNSHGTHVAGIIGGTTYGVAKNVRLHTVRVRDAQNQLSWSNVFAGFDYIMERQQRTAISADRNSTNTRAIANLSITGNANAQADAVAQMVIDAGIILVVAAGNQDNDACLRSPARVPAVVAVGATDFSARENSNSVEGDVRRGVSNTGPCITIWAPGSDIPSAGTANDTAYMAKSGTSMSAPVVAGALAMYAQAGWGVVEMLEQAEWIDALGDGNTTGLFLSIQQLNEQFLSTPIGGLISIEEEEPRAPAVSPSTEIPSAETTWSSWETITPTTISGSAQGLMTPMGEANKMDGTSQAISFVEQSHTVMFGSLIFALANGLGY
mmetsp:Transcript_4205/g.8584  ORF Transcript_4205/g.8584 Transcript_4205/m.8584 type:complete len:567 (+) Transcript_4205:199-1899(+)